MTDPVSNRDASLEPGFIGLQQTFTECNEDHSQGAGFELTSGSFAQDTDYIHPPGFAEYQYGPTDVRPFSDCPSQYDMLIRVEQQPFADIPAQSPSNDCCKGQMHQNATLTASDSFLAAYKDVRHTEFIRYPQVSSDDIFPISMERIVTLENMQQHLQLGSPKPTHQDPWSPVGQHPCSYTTLVFYNYPRFEGYDSIPQPDEVKANAGLVTQKPAVISQRGYSYDGPVVDCVDSPSLHEIQPFPLPISALSTSYPSFSPRAVASSEPRPTAQSRAVKSLPVGTYDWDSKTGMPLRKERTKRRQSEKERASTQKIRRQGGTCFPCRRGHRKCDPSHLGHRLSSKSKTGTIAATETQVAPLAGPEKMSETSPQEQIRIHLAGSNQVRKSIPHTIMAAPGLAAKTGMPLTGQVESPQDITLSCSATAPRDVSEQHLETLKAMVTTSPGSSTWSYCLCENADVPLPVYSGPEGTICTGLTPTSCSRESCPLQFVEMDLSCIEELDRDRDYYSLFAFDGNTEVPHNLPDNSGSFDMDITGIGEQFNGLCNDWITDDK